MTIDANTASASRADKLQDEGTREFDDAVSGPGPKMPKSEVSAKDDAALTRALEQSFPASDPVSAVSAPTKVGKPARSQSGEKASKP